MCDLYFKKQLNPTLNEEFEFEHAMHIMNLWIYDKEQKQLF